MSNSAINTCKLKELDAEFNADCKKQAAKANIRTAAAKPRRGGHAKVYHSSPGARPSGRRVVGACTGRSPGKGNGPGPLRRPKGRYALEHRHQIPQRSVALAGNLAHEPGADQKSAQHLPGGCPRARPERVAAAIAYRRSRRRPRGWRCRRRGKASAAYLYPAFDGRGDTRHFAHCDRAVSNAATNHPERPPRQDPADHRYV